jgi:hypothetical protein
MARIETRTRNTSYTVGAGIGAGMVAALVMGILAMIVFGARGQGFFTPLQVIAAVLMGSDALVYTFWSTLLGLGIHLITGAFFGALFALIARPIRTQSMRMAAGLTYGTVVFLVMTYLVLPWANPIMAAAIEPGWFYLYHLAYGAVLPLMLPRRATVTTTYRRESRA